MADTGKAPRWGVLLVNLGTPEAPSAAAVRRYLREFLWDPRVVELPRPLWWIILNGLILWVRPSKSARAYRSIWTDKGSPLLALSMALSRAVGAEISARSGGEIVVELAMRYGKPGIPQSLEKLRSVGIEGLLVLPLYPQYSSPSTGSVFDQVASVLKTWRYIPEIRFISDYHVYPAYIRAVARRIRDFWKEKGKAGFLLFSFHGLPERSRSLGDPYYQQCHASAKRIADELALSENDWQLVFQSRFGRGRWLQPYCVEILRTLPQRGVKDVDVVCPGFAVDCLETLEEIGIANEAVFRKAGGERYRLIPSLNDSPEHADVLAGLIKEYLQ
ncbi:Ferrochelatase [Methylocaldum marinum]|uniref:Ferrochelatase n=1 Tax=Methylocaldum marinum TaxID=1432792 RepID=A0A286P4E6_9GAMM|nr:ferrochelatase [Methylocaldum marinum]BBA37524.1 Ferrochelatase [Methylocaldum marinum]